MLGYFLSIWRNTKDSWWVNYHIPRTVPPWNHRETGAETIEESTRLYLYTFNTESWVDMEGQVSIGRGHALSDKLLHAAQVAGFDTTKELLSAASQSSPVNPYLLVRPTAPRPLKTLWDFLLERV